MGRLIDADALIETMKKVETEYEDAMTCPSWWTAYSVISEQPTAYDVEKVVAELEEHKTKAYVTGITNNPYEFGACNAMDSAIKIVNELAEEHKGGCCEWKKYENDIIFPYKTSCGTSDLYDDSYKYCPYCGKKIKVVE